MKPSKLIVSLSLVVAFLAIIVATTGLFYSGGYGPFSFMTLHGNNIEISGEGLYYYDTSFKAPILKGTDAVILFIAVPLLSLSIFQYCSGSIKGQLLLTSMLCCFLYYSTSLVFGVAYNDLFPIYIFFFSASLFAFSLSYRSIDTEKLTSLLNSKFPCKGTAIFLFIAGCSVFVWLIDIMFAIASNTVPKGVASYTTEATYVFDLGVIAPSAFAASFLLFKKPPVAYPMASSLLVLNSMIGLIVIAQTISQTIYGIELSVVEKVAFVGVFVVTSTIAIVLFILLYRNINEQKSPTQMTRASF